MSTSVKFKLEFLESLSGKIAPLPWDFTSNVPFYTRVVKPRPSASKHDARPEYWDYYDGEYVAACVNWMPDILKYVRELEEIARGELQE